MTRSQTGRTRLEHSPRRNTTPAIRRFCRLAGTPVILLAERNGLKVPPMALDFPLLERRLQQLDKTAAAGLVASTLGQDRLPVDLPDSSIQQFVPEYIENVAYQLARLEASEYGGVAAALGTAISYFTDSLTRRADSTEGFLQLLSAAYVVHRTLEAVDDLAERFLGVPLSSHDLMAANVIVQAALGDRFGQQLEQMALAALEDSAVTGALLAAQPDQANLTYQRESRLALDGEPVRCFASRYGLGLPGLYV